MTRVPRGQWVSQDKRAIKETKGCWDWWDLKERKVLLVYQGQQVQRVQPGLGVFPGPKDREGLGADLEILVKRAMRALLGFLVGMDCQGRKELKGHRGPEEQLGLQGWKDLVGPSDPSAPPVLQDFLGYLHLDLQLLQSPHSPLCQLRSLNPPNHLNLQNHLSLQNHLNPPNLNPQKQQR